MLVAQVVQFQCLTTGILVAERGRFVRTVRDPPQGGYFKRSSAGFLLENQQNEVKNLNDNQSEMYHEFKLFLSGDFQSLLYLRLQEHPMPDAASRRSGSRH